MKADSNDIRSFARHYGLDRPMRRGARYLFGLFVSDDDFRFLLDSDSAAMRSDWEAVGKDMRSAISMYKSQNAL